LFHFSYTCDRFGKPQKAWAFDIDIECLIKTQCVVTYGFKNILIDRDSMNFSFICIAACDHP